MNGHLAALRAAGQSVWLDSMRRSYLSEGVLERYRDEYDRKRRVAGARA